MKAFHGVPRNLVNSVQNSEKFAVEYCGPYP